MSHELIAAIDAGTTGIRCSIVDREGAELSYSYQRVPTIYPAPGFAEQDPRTIINLSFQAVSQAIHNCPADPRDIIGLCITNIRNSFVPMDADGGFLTNMVIWQDQRGEQVKPWMLERLKENGLGIEDLYRISGQPFGSFQSGFKAIWFRHYMDSLYRKTHKLATPQAYLTHAFGVQDYWEENNDLCCWLVADVNQARIDDTLCSVFDLDPDKFFPAVSPGTKTGTVSGSASRATGLVEGTPIYAGSGDQQCGALGAGNYGTQEMLTICMGTAGLCIAWSPKPIRHPDGKCQVHGHPAGGYTIESHSSSCMSSYQWLKDTFFAEDKSMENIDGLLMEEAEKAPAGSGGVVFLPWLQGAACPHYDDSARGVFAGMTLATGKKEIIRSVVEGISFETKMMLDTLVKPLALPIKRIRLLGGASHSSFWNQLQADIYGLPVETTVQKEATVLGAAMIGAVGAGLYKDFKEAVLHMTKREAGYVPVPANTEKYEEIFELWNECYHDLSRSTFGKIHHYQKKLRHGFISQMPDDPDQEGIR